MTGGQIANGIGSAVALVTSGTFILAWTIVGRWWKTSTGRFMVMKAGAICLTGIITVWLTLVEFTNDWDALRWVQGGLWVLISLAFIHHTVMVICVNRKKDEE